MSSSNTHILNLFGSCGGGRAVAVDNLCLVEIKNNSVTWKVKCQGGILTINGEERLKNVRGISAYANRVEATLYDGSCQTLYYSDQPKKEEQNPIDEPKDEQKTSDNPKKERKGEKEPPSNKFKEKLKGVEKKTLKRSKTIVQVGPGSITKQKAETIVNIF